MLVSFSFEVGFGVAVFASLRTTVRWTTFDLYHPNFSLDMRVKKLICVRRNFMTLNESRIG